MSIYRLHVPGIHADGNVKVGVKRFFGLLREDTANAEKMKGSIGVNPGG